MSHHPRARSLTCHDNTPQHHARVGALAVHHPVWMSRHTHESRQDIHSTRVPVRGKGVDGSTAAHTQTNSSSHPHGHQQGSGGRHDDHGTTTLHTTGDQPDDWQATSRRPSLLVLFPDNTGGVHVGKDDLDVATGDQVNESDDLWWLRTDGKTQVLNERGQRASSDVTLRQQLVTDSDGGVKTPVRLNSSNRTVSISGCTRQVCRQQ